jgi:hypothetical protein
MHTDKESRPRNWTAAYREGLGTETETEHFWANPRSKPVEQVIGEMILPYDLYWVGIRTLGDDGKHFQNASIAVY